MNTTVEPIAELTARARHVLIRAADPCSRRVRCHALVESIGSGHSNYVQDRAELYKAEKVNGLVAEIKATRKT